MSVLLGQKDFFICSLGRCTNGLLVFFRVISGFDLHLVSLGLDSWQLVTAIHDEGGSDIV